MGERRPWAWAEEDGGFGRRLCDARTARSAAAGLKPGATESSAWARGAARMGRGAGCTEDATWRRWRGRSFRAGPWDGVGSLVGGSAGRRVGWFDGEFFHTHGFSRRIYRIRL